MIKTCRVENIINFICLKFKYFVATILGATLLAMCSIAYAGPSNCDGEMNEDQRFQSGLCTAHAGCRFVMTLFDTCSGIKNYVGKLGLGSKASGAVVKDATVEDALTNSGLTSANISSCLFSFDRALCRQYLGLEAPPASVPNEPYKAPRKTELLDLARILESEQQRTKTSLPAYFDLRNALAGCENAKDTRDQDSVCAIAQSRIKECKEFRDGWYRRRESVLAEGPKEGITDLVASLRRLEMLECPTTMPGSGLTPDQALAEWSKTKTATSDMIIRCDSLQRDASAAIDDAPSKAVDAVNVFEKSCAGQRADYAATSQAFRKRLEVQSASKVDSTAPLRRGSSSATQLFNESIASNEIRIREQREAAEKERLAAIDRAKSDAIADNKRQADIRQGSVQPATSGYSDRTTTYTTCLQALENFDSMSGVDEDRRRAEREASEGRSTTQMVNEQRMWRIKYHLQIVNKLSVCEKSNERKLLSEGLERIRADCQCENGKNYWSDESKYNEALRKTLNRSNDVPIMAQTAATRNFPIFPAECDQLNKASAEETVKFTRLNLSQAYQQNRAAWENVVRYAARDPAELAEVVRVEKTNLLNGSKTGSEMIHIPFLNCLREYALKTRSRWDVRPNGAIYE